MCPGGVLRGYHRRESCPVFFIKAQVRRMTREMNVCRREQDGAGHEAGERW